jgi:hypothetical protein
METLRQNVRVAAGGDGVQAGGGPVFGRSIRWRAASDKMMGIDLAGLFFNGPIRPRREPGCAIRIILTLLWSVPAMRG